MDDISIFADDPGELRRIASWLEQALAGVELELNTTKTELFACAESRPTSGESGDRVNTNAYAANRTVDELLADISANPKEAPRSLIALYVTRFGRMAFTIWGAHFSVTLTIFLKVLITWHVSSGIQERGASSKNGMCGTQAAIS
jgi:hypothetical protein